MILCTKGVIITDRMLEGWRMDGYSRKKNRGTIPPFFFWNTAKYTKFIVHTINS